MEKKKPLIVFIEGSCGNFLANFLFSEELPDPDYRISDQLYWKHCVHPQNLTTDRIKSHDYVMLIKPDRNDFPLFFSLVFTKKYNVPSYDCFFQRIDWFFSNMKRYNQMISELDRIKHDLRLSMREILDIDQLSLLHERICGRCPSEYRIQWARQYMEKQTLYEDHAFSIAYQIFQFELYNGFLEKKRNWSINSLTQSNANKLLRSYLTKNNYS